jgi:hypothetical protein
MYTKDLEVEKKNVKMDSYMPCDALAHKLSSFYTFLALLGAASQSLPVCHFLAASFIDAQPLGVTYMLVTPLIAWSPKTSPYFEKAAKEAYIYYNW